MEVVVENNSSVQTELSILGTEDLVILEPVRGRVDQDLSGNKIHYFFNKS